MCFVCLSERSCNWCSVVSFVFGVVLKFLVGLW